MFYVLPGVVLLWGSLWSAVRPVRPHAFWAWGALGTAAMLGVQAVGEPVLGELEAAVGAYAAMALVMWAARGWVRRVAERRPARGRHQVRMRQRGLGEAGGEPRAAGSRRAPVDVSVAQARAIDLANRRAIRWKDNP